MLNWIPRRVRLLKAAPKDSAGNGKEFDVKLERSSGELYDGQATAESVATELKAAAEATLEALRKVVGEAADIKLRGVMPVSAFGHSLIVVGVKVTHGNETRSLFGLSPFIEDRGKSAAMATLNAVNRFLGLG